MRVNDLAKELGKPNKEIIEILQKNQIDVKSHMSSVSDDQAALVRKSYASGAKSAPAGAQKNVSAAEAKPAAPAKAKEAAKPEEKPRLPPREPAGAGAAGQNGEQPKKRIAAVFRPQNSTQMRNNRQGRPGRAAVTDAPPARAATDVPGGQNFQGRDGQGNPNRDNREGRRPGQNARPELPEP